MPLYVLDRNDGCSLNRIEVPWGSLVLSVQALRDGVTLRGRVCVSVYVLDRIVGFPEPLFSSSFAMRSPLWVKSAYLCMYSIGTKVLTFFFLHFEFLRDGSTCLGSSIRIHASSVRSKELLVAGCCALALLDAYYLTVDCLLMASSATTR